MTTNKRGQLVVRLLLGPLALMAGASLAQAEQQVVVEQPPAAQPAPAPVVVAPAPAAAPVQAVPVQAPSTTHKTVNVEDKPQGNFMATIAKSTFFGVITGAIIGGAVYFIDSPRRDAEHIGYWAAGGALLGLGVGVINVAVNQDHSERAISRLDSGSTGRAFGVRLLNARF